MRLRTSGLGDREPRRGECGMQAKCRSSGSYLEACVQRCLQRQFAWRDPQFICSTNLLHHALNEVVEDLQLAVEGFDELLVWHDSHDNFWKHVMPAWDIDPAALGNVELTLQLRPETFMNLTGNPVFDLRLR